VADLEREDVLVGGLLVPERLVPDRSVAAFEEVEDP